MALIASNAAIVVNPEPSNMIQRVRSTDAPSRFADDWSDRYQILDHAFGQFTAAWERPAGPAFIRFVDQKLSFDEADFTRLQVKDKP